MYMLKIKIHHLAAAAWEGAPLGQQQRLAGKVVSAAWVAGEIEGRTRQEG
jgi:hypothetical protein